MTDMNQPIRNEKPKTDLKTSDFYYDLPQERIAQHPLEPRDSSRLMVLNRADGSVTHRHFYDLCDYLRPEDVLVINDSKVIPARLYGTPADRPDAPLELLLLRQRELDVWETLVRPGKRARVGMELVFGEGLLRAVVTDIVEEGNRLVRFSYDRSRFANVYDILHRVGTMPLPPYITERLEDGDRYQTVYAREEGSAAAPTAGLHFTPELIEKLKKKGVEFAEVLLHVGLGTFRPVKAEDVTKHVMHTEFYAINAANAEKINRAKREGRRVIAVGTTSVRTLETVADENGFVRECSGETNIFIYPPYKFRCVDALITNFHLPESTLVMLVAAFASREKILELYDLAVREKYRFFSFGDCMLIL